MDKGNKEVDLKVFTIAVYRLSIVHVAEINGNVEAGSHVFQTID